MLEFYDRHSGEFGRRAAFLLSVFCWCITVGLAWVSMRPAYGLAIIVLALVAVSLPTLMAKFDAPVPQWQQQTVNGDSMPHQNSL